ncbi:MAG: ABC transporter permease [Adlercreutzia equolifaciens]
MKIGDLFYETWHALSANKGRSFLTILGIVIGIAAVIAMTSLIAGVQNMLMGEMGLPRRAGVHQRLLAAGHHVRRPGQAGAGHAGVRGHHRRVVRVGRDRDGRRAEELRHGHRRPPRFSRRTDEA